MKKCLPYNNIIEEYLSIDFKKKDNNTEEISKIKNLVNGIINNNKYGKKPVITKIFTEETDNNNYGLSKKEELENFINLELLNDSKNKNNNINNNNVVNIPPDSGISNTSSILTRSNIKNKEVEDIIEEASRKSIIDENDGEETITSETSEVDSTEDTTESNVVLTSPPAIKKNNIDRIFDDINKPLIQDPVLNKKKSIEVVLNKNNNVPDNFDKLESYYDNLIKANIN